MKTVTLCLASLTIAQAANVPATAALHTQMMEATTGDVFTLAADTTYAWSKFMGFGSPSNCADATYCSSATSVTLQGAGAGSSIIDAAGKTFFIMLYTGGTVALKDLTLTNGDGDAAGGTIGAIWNRGGILTLDRVAFVKNKGSSVGAIAASRLGSTLGSTTLNACSFTGNTGMTAGAIAGESDEYSNATINGVSTCSFFDNSAPVCSGLSFTCPAPSPPPTSAAQWLTAAGLLQLVAMAIGAVLLGI